jgi:heptosyltransferase-2
MKKALILRLSSIGDVILTTPFLRALKRARPELEIHAAVRPEYADLLRYHPAVSRLLEIDVSSGVRGLLEANRLFRAGGYDTVYDLHNTPRTGLLRLGVARDLRVVRKRSLRRFLLVRCGVPIRGKTVPVAERYIETAGADGAIPDGRGPDLHFPDDIHERMAERIALFLNGRGIPLLAFCPGARHETKRWPVERFISLRDLILRETNAGILLLGGPSDRERAEALSTAGEGRVLNLCASASLPESAAAMDHCSAVLSNDSGLMHMACARGIPVVALFGCTVGEFGFFPYNSASTVHEIHGLPCRPCTHIGLPRCPEGHFRCLRDITPESVFVSLSKHLGR